jgi:hypothetical protein
MSNEELDQIERTMRMPGFEARDIVWALGMCVVTLSLTPVMAVYVLLVS